MTVPEKDAALAATGSGVCRPFRGLLTPERCRKHVRRKIAERLPEVCEGLLKQAIDGNVTAAKLLLQMAALDGRDLHETASAPARTGQLASVRKMLAEFREKPLVEGARVWRNKE